MNKKQMNTTKVFRFKRFARKSYSVFNSLHKAVTIGVLAGTALISAHAASVNPVETTYKTTLSDSIPQEELEEIVVTASKVNLPLNLAAKQVTVITATDIERSPVRSVEDLLQYVAGVDVLQRGPHGVQADISLRGGSFDQAAILLNGVNLTNPQTGHYSFDIPINLSDIERIEIVQGPASLLYGAGAFSGGINIITKRDSESNAYAKVEGGMHGLFGAEARGAYKTGSSLHRLSAGYKRSDGYIANSDYNILNLLWQSRFDLQDADIDVQAGYNDKDYGANTFYSAQYPNQFDDTEAIFASVRGETHGRLKFIPHLYWSRHYDEYQLIREGTPNVPEWYTDHNYHRSDVFGANLNMQYASSLGITSFGGEFRNEGILSSVLGQKMDQAIGKYTKSYNRTNISYFLEHNFVVDQFTLSLGGLLNHNTAIVNKYSFYPAVNASFRATKNVSLYASWNKATRMPTFTDLYYNTTTHSGNDALLPEYSQSLEGGIKYHNRFLNSSVALYHNRGQNLIDWIKPDADSKWQAINLDKDEVLKTYGGEASFSLFLDEIVPSGNPFKLLQLGYAYLTQDYASQKEINNPVSMYVRNFLRHKFTANLVHTLVKDLSVSWNFRWQDRAGSYVNYAHSADGEKTDYKPFSILDIKVNYEWKDFDFSVNANNVFNSQHIDLGNIPQAGFWLTGGISYRIR
ncbi:MAG TPA: TonB-dependent receptor [Porphyromonadaceae bacterium]|jgi:iron complex outermembrane receptor protein|nr:TonB-dependent receptor [Porphyromonadaceae bacterium]HBL33804.1 TonB-dependent receptor [Porphyromonadaceae bacterium]HBX44995.1 TonB-dependent receptor [Porphyromonadaceae bacterium]